MKQHKEFSYGRVVTLRDQGMSLRQIGMEVGICKSTVSNYLKKYKKCGQYERKKGYGRPLLINSTEMYIIKDIHNKNPKTSVPKLNKIFENRTNKKISDSTMRRGCKKFNLRSYSAIKKPLLSKKHSF